MQALATSAFTAKAEVSRHGRGIPNGPPSEVMELAPVRRYFDPSHVSNKAMNRRRVRGGAAVAAGLLACVLVTPSALAAFPGENGRIVYAHAKAVRANAALFSVRPSGKGRRRLTSAKAPNTEPNVSPDGRRIVFVRIQRGDFHIWIMHADGSHEKKLTNGTEDVEPAFVGPDGKRIVFTRDGHLYIMRADGSHAHRLVHGLGNTQSASSSPDGRWLVFSGRKHGTSQDIYVVHPNGHGLRRLTSMGTRELQPDFAPSGERIVFIRLDRSTQQVTLWSMRSNGSEAHQLPVRNLRDPGSPSYSPSGHKIVYADKSNLILIHADGSHKRRIAAKGFNWAPAWSVAR